MHQFSIDIVKEQRIIEKFLAFVLIGAAIAIVFKDAYNMENGWVHSEIIFYHIKFLSNSAFERIELSFGLEELKKLFWWEEVLDGSQNRLLTGLFALIDIKFRPWLFQYIPPNPAVSLSWLTTLFLTPLLLYNFIRRYIKLDILGSAAVTVLFIDISGFKRIILRLRDNASAGIRAIHIKSIREFAGYLRLKSLFNSGNSSYHICGFLISRVEANEQGLKRQVVCPNRYRCYL